MKKFLLSLTLLCLMGCFIACGKDEVSNSENDTQDTVVDNNEKTENQDESTKNNEDNVEKNNGWESEGAGYKSVYYDYPAESHFIREEQAIDFVLEKEEIMVGVYSDLEQEFNDSVEDVITFVNEDRFTEAASFAGEGLALWLGSDIVVTSSEVVTMAGMDSMKFTGTTEYMAYEQDHWDCYVYGYTFVIEDVSYAVIGLVIPKEQEQSMIDDMKNQVDGIAATIRNGR